MFPTLEGPTRLFARGGAAASEAPNSIESFTLALRLGATGLQSELWATSDDNALLDSGGQVGSRFRKRRISEMTAAELAGQKPTVAELYERLGSDFDLMIDVRDPAAFDPLLGSAMDATALGRLWIMSSDLTLLERWRTRVPESRLVHATRMSDLGRGPERHAATLREARVDAVSLPFDEWTAGHVALFHRFTRLAVAWGPVHERHMRDLLGMGMDAIVSSYVERMVDASA